MGSPDDKPRKPRHHLRKVPKYEEPNTLSLPGLTGDSEMGQSPSRFGHGSDGTEHHRPGVLGRAFLKLLGMRQQHPEDVEPVTREHENKTTS
jgi:hypothetical protein